MYYIIDRFENGVAVLEDESGTMSEFDRSIIPAEAREGMKLKHENGIFTIADNSETEQRIKSKMDMLFGK
ncbi:MAG: DUF3006 domain-containing protein [Ruminococcaceae bacterium]|nr:DUF3006 domain-containing protein [Oscillospiraceae bacterium]